MKWVMRTCHFQTYLKVKKNMSNKTCRKFRKSVSLGLQLCSWISCRLPSVFLEFSVGAWQMWSCQVLSLQWWESPTLDPYPQHPEKPLQSPCCDTWSATLWMPSSDWWVTCSWCKVPKLAKLAVLIQNGKMVPKFWSRTWLTQTSRGWSLHFPAFAWRVASWMFARTVLRLSWLEKHILSQSLRMIRMSEPASETLNISPLRPGHAQTPLWLCCWTGCCRFTPRSCQRLG